MALYLFNALASLATPFSKAFLRAVQEAKALEATGTTGLAGTTVFTGVAEGEAVWDALGLGWLLTLGFGVSAPPTTPAVPPDGLPATGDVGFGVGVGVGVLTGSEL